MLTWRPRSGTCVAARPLRRPFAANQMHAIMLHDTEDRLKTIKVPTLVIHGDEDVVVPVENGRLLAAKIPGARLLILPGVGHLCVGARRVTSGLHGARPLTLSLQRV